MMFAQTPALAGDDWFDVVLAVIFVAGSVITALIANRARITANETKQQVTPNGGASAHDRIMRAIDELRADVRVAVERDDGRFVGLERRVEKLEGRISAGPVEGS